MGHLRVRGASDRLLVFLITASPCLASTGNDGPGLKAGLMFLGMVGVFLYIWIRMRE